jgi:hypothetical protein
MSSLYGAESPAVDTAKRKKRGNESLLHDFPVILRLVSREISPSDGMQSYQLPVTSPAIEDDTLNGQIVTGQAAAERRTDRIDWRWTYLNALESVGRQLNLTIYKKGFLT